MQYTDKDVRLEVYSSVDSNEHLCMGGPFEFGFECEFEDIYFTSKIG